MENLHRFQKYWKIFFWANVIIVGEHLANPILELLYKIFTDSTFRGESAAYYLLGIFMANALLGIIPYLIFKAYYKKTVVENKCGWLGVLMLLKAVFIMLFCYEKDYYKVTFLSLQVIVDLVLLNYNFKRGREMAPPNEESEASEQGGEA